MANQDNHVMSTASQPAEPGKAESKRAPYSAKVIECGRHPKHLGVLDPPDAFAILTGWCGEVLAIFIRLDDQQIREASFMADGCISTMACGDTIATMICGRSMQEAAQITPQDLIAALDGLPEWSTHCAELAVNTLREAIDNHAREMNRPGGTDHARA